MHLGYDKTETTDKNKQIKAQSWKSSNVQDVE